MANLQELENYESGIYQLETTDPVVAGPDGISNRQAKQLANRTAWLKLHVDQLISDLGNLDINDILGLQASLDSKLANINYTANDVLQKLLTVDGNGSGVDADKVRGLAADFSHSLSENGYQKLPGGLIIQWGISTSISERRWVPFPIAFPNSIYVAVPQAREQGGGGLYPSTIFATRAATDGFELLTAGTSGGTSIANYIAIGA